MKRRPDLEAFAAEHRLALITIADLVTYLRAASGRWAEPASFSAG
jgi:3,4-dihydroxy 2-butanone 4-phosphate synthase/GTP cyclohydrolase II